MKLPKYIQDEIKKAGKAAQINRDSSEIVREWLTNQGLINDQSENITDENVVDFLIDSIESGRNGSDGLINYLKKI
jgi:hypothetical protein